MNLKLKKAGYTATPVARGWAGAEMRVFALSQLDDLYGPTDQPTDGRTDGQSLLQSRLSAT